MKQFNAFLHKEFLHILRDKRTMLILLLLPVVMVLLFGFAITTEVKNTRISVYDPLHSANTERIKQMLANNSYFILQPEMASPKEAESLFQQGLTDVVLIFSSEFDRQFQQPTEALVQLQADASEPNQAQTRVGLVQQALILYCLQQMPGVSAFQAPTTQMLFNPQQRGEFNFVPGLIGMLLMLICAMMSSIAIVREKENGTMEVLLASPLPPAVIIIAKLIPYFVVSSLDLALILILSVTVLDVPIDGSLTVILLFCLLYIMMSLSLGLLVSTLVDSQLAAMLISGMMVMMPLLAMLVFPWAANQEVKHLNIAVVDLDNTQASRRLIEEVSASPYFTLVDVPETDRKAMELINSNEADLILTIPNDYDRLHKQVHIAANATNGMKGGLGAAYLTQLVQGGMSQNMISTYYKYNTHLDYKVFMAPAIMVMLLTLLTGFLPALNIVGEKEKGTIKQINVTPVGKFEFILSKLIPYWCIGLVALAISLIVCWLMYDLVPAGGYLPVIVFTLVYILVVSGFGLIVSNTSNTMQQALFVIFFFLMCFILLSGLFTPVASMPKWAQIITRINPLSYFIEAMRAIFLKGSGIVDLLPKLLALSGFAVVLDGLAILTYKKNG